MGFNPFKEKGVPLEKQVLAWSDINSKPYESSSVHPFTRARGILMNGIEVEAVLFYHNFHRHTSDMELRRKLAMIRRIEQQEQKMINWMIPAEESVLEITIGYEQLAVDLTATMAKNEPDKYVKAALDFALIEDFDHLYRYANLLALTGDKQAELLVGELTEIMPGRPTVVEHLHPFDSVRKFYSKNSADPITKMHVATIIAAEQQTMNYYMNVGNRIANTVGRALYQEIAQIEEQHVTHYGSLEDPSATWFEMAVLHEYNECYMYYSCMSSEPDDDAKKVWQRCLENEIEHLHMAVEMAKKYEKRDLTEEYPAAFPDLTILESSKEYVRDIIANQMHFTTDMTEFVPMSRSENKQRYDQYQTMVNSGDYVPSQQVVLTGVNETGKDYRLETEGPHPIDILRTRDKIPGRDQIVEYSLKR